MFREAIHLRHDSPRAYNAFGVSLAAQGQYGDAIINFGRALDLDPSYEAAKRNLESARRQRDGSRVPSTSTAPSPS
jgi:lipoprotein NlpI